MENIEKPDFIIELENYTDDIINNGLETDFLTKLRQDIQECNTNGKDITNNYTTKEETEVIDNAIAKLNQLRMMAEMVLLRSFSTFREDKYLLIFTATSNMINWLQMKEDYDSILEEVDHCKLYFEDALEKSPDNFNMISSICDLLYTELDALLEVEKDVKNALSYLDEYTSFLTVAADRDKYKLSAGILLGQIADSLSFRQLTEISCRYYLQAISLLNLENLDIATKRILAMFIGHYNVALMNLDEKDLDLIEQNLDKEENLFTQLHDAIGNIQSKMDLAIAYSHRGNFHNYNQNYVEEGKYHLKKIHLITETFELDDKSDYTKEARLDSLMNSVQPVINFALYSSEKDRLDIFEDVYAQLMKCHGYTLDIRLLQYANSFAMEVFKITENTNITVAENYLFKKISVLLNLINDYGYEDGIVDDLLSTINESKSFMAKNSSNVGEHNIEVWNVAIKILQKTNNEEYDSSLYNKGLNKVRTFWKKFWK